jgi:hypothetical protein
VKVWILCMWVCLLMRERLVKDMCMKVKFLGVCLNGRYVYKIEKDL